MSGLPCTDGAQTMVDLASSLDDLVWERLSAAQQLGDPVGQVQ